MQTDDEIWGDDLIGGRKSSADMLYQLVMHKVAERQYREKEALCFTLDGDWGAGKSFFLERFTRQLKGQEHSVVRFDAWINDLSEQPLLGFMVELREALQDLASSGRQRPTKAVEQSLQTLMSSAKKAILPAALAALKHTAIRTLGNEAVSAFTGEADNVDGQEIALQAGDAFKTALDSYQDMRQAVDDLRKSLADLLQKLQDEGRLKLPLFVVIDELDRCRPSYALRLLEGVKHLFASPNVCFVVATNTKQLAESVRAIYGSGFDGHQYLKKFFAFEFRIPTGSSLRLTKSLITSESVLMKRRAVTGMPSGEPDEDTRHEGLAQALDLVARSFRLPPRTLQQVTFISEAAASGLPSTFTPHAFYLFCVAAMAHKDPYALPAALNANNSRQEISSLLEGLGFVDQVIPGRNKNPQTVRNLFIEYASWAMTDLGVLVRSGDTDWSKPREFNILRNLKSMFDQEAVGGVPHGEKVYPSIALYPELVITAGCFRST